MNHGKDLCNKLKAIRKAVADANGIEYNSTECHHTGDCPGTCPVCDAELERINMALQQKIDRGENINVPRDVLDAEILDTRLHPLIVDELLPTPGIIPMQSYTDEPESLLGDIVPPHEQVRGNLLTPEQMIDKENKKRRKRK